MKKLISMLLAFCMVVVPLNATVFASNLIIGPDGCIIPVEDENASDYTSANIPTSSQNITAEKTTVEPITKTSEQSELYAPLNSNFKKQATFSTDEVDLNALGVANWCREDFIHLYELGFTELATHEFANTIQSSTYTDYYCVISSFYNLLKMYYGEEIIKGEMSSNELSNAKQYLIQKNILRSGEITDYFNSPTRQDIQILITRLFDTIDAGYPINSLDRIADVDSNSPNNIDFEGVLELYNMGIFAGNSHGEFNAYDYITLNEFVTVLARICFSNRRVHINTEEYYQRLELPKETIKTYNSIDTYWYQRIKELSHLDSLYLKGSAPDRSMSLSEILYIVSYVLENKWNSEKVGPFADNSDEYLQFIKNSFNNDKACRRIVSYLYLSEEDVSTKFLHMTISKKDFARLLMTIAQEFFLIDEPSNTTLRNELSKNLCKEDLRLLVKAVKLGIIEDTVDDFSDKALTQSEFEKMLVQFIIKFSTVAAQNKNRYGIERVNLITDPSLLPKNMELFPYITDVLSKEVYESVNLSTADFGYKSEEEYIKYHGTPRNNYNPSIVDYAYSDEEITGYFDTILNVDYRTISVEEFTEDISQYLYYDLYSPFGKDIKESIENYVNYVKKNKIILSGKGTPDFSCMYTLDNLMLSTEVLGCKIKVNVINSDVENPKLLLSCFNNEYFSNPNAPSVKYAKISVSPVGIYGTNKTLFKIHTIPNITE